MLTQEQTATIAEVKTLVTSAAQIADQLAERTAAAEAALAEAEANVVEFKAALADALSAPPAPPIAATGESAAPLQPE